VVVEFRRELPGPDPGSVRASGDTAPYDLRIASTEDALRLEASTSADTLCAWVVEPAADLDP
jgi:hypothetical protein